MLHTDIPSSATIRQLASARNEYSVSIYLPTSPLPLESERSRIELRNQAVAAAEQLAGGGASRAYVEEF
jgi:hypothetical protein